MKTSRNVIQSLLLALLALPLVSRAQFTFTTNNGAITITKYTGSGGAVIIPSSTNGWPVTSIGTNAFYNANPTKVTIPHSVTNIGSFAFFGCGSLTYITLPTNIIFIQDFTFYGFSKLNSVTNSSGL